MLDFITIGDCTNDIFVKPTDDHFSRRQISITGNKLYIRHGDKITVDEMHDEIGGGAANVAVGLARLGLSAAIIGMVGEDVSGAKVRQKLTQENVSQLYLKNNKKMSTNTSVIIVYQKERTIFVYRGLKDYSKLTLPKNPRTKWIYLGPVSQEFSINYAKLISLASEKNIKIAVNPGNRQILEGRSELLKLLRVTNVLIMNLQEVSDLTKLSKFTNIKKILTTVKSYGSETVIITDGGNGAYVASGNDFWGIGVFPIEVIDPTGAGDAFSSGFLASYCQKNDLNEAIRYAIINSALVTQEYGAQTNLQNNSQIEKMLRHAPKLYKL